MATTPKGWVDLTNLSDMDGAEQINDAVHHAEDLVNPTVATASGLPTSGNWPGRIIMAEDTNILWVNLEGNSTWTILAIPGMKRYYNIVAAVSAVGNGTTITSIPIPAYPFAYRMKFLHTGTIGFSGTTGQFRLDTLATGTTLTVPGRQNMEVASGKWGFVAEGGYLDVPTNTAFTAIARFVGTQTGYANVFSQYEVMLPGEY